MKQIMRGLFLILVMMMLSGCGSDKKVSSYYRGNVSVTLAMGNRNLLSQGRKVPVEVVITGDYASEHYTVALNVPTNEEDFYCYQEPIQKNGQDRIVFMVPVAAHSRQMVVEILNEKDQVIYSRTCSYQFAPMEEHSGEIVIGMIGVPQENTIWNFTASYDAKNYLIRTVKLQQENLLTISEAYDLYDLLVIEGDSIARMSNEQIEAIRTWVENGGRMLLVGTGDHARKMGFSLLVRVKTSKLIEFADKSKYKIEEGILWITTKLILNKNRAQEDQMKILEALLGDEFISKLQYMENQHILNKAMTDGLEWQGSVGIMADKTVYFAIFCIYLLMVIPGIYCILRKIDRLNLFRICICITACLVSLIIWVAGSKTRYSKPFLHSISITSGEQGKQKQHIYVSIQAPYNREYQVSFLPEYEISAFQKDGNWIGNTYNSYEQDNVMVRENEHNIQLTLGNMSAFTPQYFELNKKMVCYSAVNGEIEVFSENRLEGRLKNCLDTELSQVAILIEDWVYLLDTWEAEELIDIEKIPQKLSISEFMEDGHRFWGEWDAEYVDIYRAILKQEMYRASSQACMIARTQEEISIQLEQEYQQKQASFFVTGVKVKHK